MMNGPENHGQDANFGQQVVARIDIHKESLHFSCAHFTIFDEKNRENLHGHNYFVSASASGLIADDGLCFDYNKLKDALASLCDHLDESTLLPTKSPHLQIELQDQYVNVVFGTERMSFLKRDILMLSISNVTVEELARWLLEQLIDTNSVTELPIDELVLTVASGPSESASVTWTRR